MKFSTCVYPKLQKALVKKGCTYQQFARGVNISGSNAYFWLMGKNQHTIDVIKAILEYSGLTFEEAFEGGPKS